MSKELNLGALPIARNEYLNQLVSFLQPLISKGFWAIYQDARKKCSKENRKHERFKEFQFFVKQIPFWSSLIIEDETRRIKEKVDCLSELITVIFVGNVKILASIRLKGEHKNIKVKVPSCNNFIHTVYINTARKVYYNPLLFDHKCKSIESNSNMEVLYGYIESAIIESIQQMLPLKSILDEYLGNAFDESDNDKSDDDKSDNGSGSYLDEIDSIQSDVYPDKEIKRNVIDFGNKPPVLESGSIIENESDDESEIEENIEEENIEEENIEEENIEEENNVEDVESEIESEIEDTDDIEDNDDIEDDLPKPFPDSVGPGIKTPGNFNLNLKKFNENDTRKNNYKSFFNPKLN